MRLALSHARAIGGVVAVCLVSGCGGNDPPEKVIVDNCGPGTALNQSTNLCAPVNDVDGGGGSGASGGAAGTGGRGDNDASAGAAGAAAGTGGEAGAAGTGEAGSSGSGGNGGTGWVDDDCGNYAPGTLLSQGDSHCPNYDPKGLCAMGAPSDPIATLQLADFEAGELIVRTPSKPGSMPQCESGCTGPGTIAKVRIPIAIPTPFTDPDVITVDHVGLGGNQTGDPWRLVLAYVDNDGSDVCTTPMSSDCLEVRTAQVVISLETDDPNAPAREFRLMYQDTGGLCQ